MGLEHKHHWRRVRERPVACCFVRVHCGRKRGRSKYESLCGRYMLAYAYGQWTSRPPSQLRCPLCDGGEIDLLRREDSANESANWKEQWQHSYPAERLA